MIAVIADIHGNLPALEAVLRDIDMVGCEQIVSLGDVAGYYCMLNQCIALLRERNIPNVMGNHDEYILGGGGCPRSQSATRCLEFQAKYLTSENRHWLASSGGSLELGDVSMVHGGWQDPVDEYLYAINAEYFRLLPARYFFSGHTHVQVQARVGDKLYCNPGSVGQPRDGDYRAAYAIFDGHNVTLKRIPYDVSVIANEMKNNGFEPHYYENLFVGTRIGGARSQVVVT